MVRGMGWMVWDHRSNDLHTGIRSFFNIKQFDRILPDGQYDIPHKSLVGELPICDSNLGRRQGATNVFFETQTS